MPMRNKTLFFGGDPDDERRLVAVRKFDTVQAIGPNLVRQLFLIDVRKTELSEKTA